MFKLVWLGFLLGLSNIAQGQGSIEGTVRHSTDKHPLAGATVQVKGSQRAAVTDAFGWFRLDKLSAGEQNLIIRYVGYKETTQTISTPLQAPLEILMEESTIVTDEVVVTATRAGEKTPTTYSNVTGSVLQKQNFGQDLPLLLNWMPSVVTTSDAGAGIGYTGIRIRGSDATRVNVTINGIPYNDSESQATYWVDIPDIASSTQSVQIQRGVGTSTNGPGAFGASVNLQTNALNADPYMELISAFGSFNSQRYTLKAGTGLIHDHWSFDVKLSSIRSDGYVERASSNLGSYYISAGFQSKHTVVKAINFGGTERTYQSWYGLDGPTMSINRRMNYAGAIYNPDGSIARYYDNQVDDYRQDHYQLHVSQQLNNAWSANLSFHYTHGRGYYEEYHQGTTFSDLGLPPITLKDTTLTSSDVVVRKWLDNNFYGATYAFHYDQGKTNLIIGGALNQYGNARHFGEVTWAQYAGQMPPNYEYYHGKSTKNDFNTFIKWNYQLTGSLNTFIDLQYRAVDYKTSGTKDDLTPYDVSDQFNFFNPKLGLTYSLSDKNSLYASYAVSHREPNRADYIDGTSKPRPEQLGNLEMGYRRRSDNFLFEANYYWMNYTDQLVLTGKIDNAGYPIRENVGKSYRTGLELSGVIRFSNELNWNLNATISTNKNLDYVLVESSVPVTKDTKIVLSPDLIAGSQLSWTPVRHLTTVWLSKYVGKQYLDNTEQETLSLNPYWINDLRVTWQLFPKQMRELDFSFLLNNVLDVSYSSNGYVYGNAPYFYPQAGRNFMAMMTLKF